MQLEINEQKKLLRKEVKRLKEDLSNEERKRQSDHIFNELEKTEVFQRSKVVLMFWSMPDEVITHNFVNQWYTKKVILLPVMDGADLILKQFTGEENMVCEEKYKIYEPVGKEFKELEKIDLIIVPGVAFDKCNNRMGRGKAFYDKLLVNTTAIKVGICYDVQYFEKVPADIHDIKMDYIIHG